MIEYHMAKSKVLPSISVMMVNYNYDKYIGEAIESILNQTFTDFELIIYDDASTDHSVEVIKKHQKKDKRIIYILGRKNKGEAYGRNQILKKVRGKYIAILDSDDLAHPQRLEIQYRYMEENPKITILGSAIIAILGSAINCIGNSQRIHRFEATNDKIRVALLFDSSFFNPTTFIRKAFFDITQLTYNETIPIAPDYQLWVDAALNKNYPVQFANLKKVLVDYRKHENNLTNGRNRSMFIKAHIYITQKTLSELGIEANDENIRKHMTFSNLFFSDVLSHFIPIKTFQQNRYWMKILLQANARVNLVSQSQLYKIGHKKIIQQLLRDSIKARNLDKIKAFLILSTNYKLCFLTIQIVLLYLIKKLRFYLIKKLD